MYTDTANTLQFSDTPLSDFVKEVTKDTYPSKKERAAWSNWELSVVERINAMKSWQSFTLFSSMEILCKTHQQHWCVPIDKNITEAWMKASSAQREKYGWVGTIDPRTETKLDKGRHVTSGHFAMLFNMFAWCKQGGQFVRCTKDQSANVLRANGVVSGQEAHLPYTKLDILHKNEKDITVCAAELYYRSLVCTTCCCSKGMMSVDKSFILTTVNQELANEEGFKDKTMSQFCADWFGSLEPIVTAVFGFFTTTMAQKEKMNAKCL